MSKTSNLFDVVVIGGGPAGMATASRASKAGLRTLIIEREERLGGILKQCIHDGFGVVKFNKRLSGPEYAHRYVKIIEEMKIEVYNKTFVSKVKKIEDLFELTLVNSNEGLFTVSSKTVVLSTGCRERTSKQVFINGTRPSGVYTAGTAQYFTNILGYLPCKKCVILGSGDIGLIMARRLTLEGVKVLGVYEAKGTPSGLSRNICQCLEDFSIPLHLSHTVTRVFGEYKLEGVEVCRVNERMEPVKGTEETIECDGLILSVGLIPENEVGESLGVEIDNRTKGPKVDQNFMSSIRGIFSCGNALHVNDLVDYVSESGELAGSAIEEYIYDHKEPFNISIEYEKENFLYITPQRINLSSNNSMLTLYFRSLEVKKNVQVNLILDHKVVFSRKYSSINPPEMERLQMDLEKLNIRKDSILKFTMEELT